MSPDSTPEPTRVSPSEADLASGAVKLTGNRASRAVRLYRSLGELEKTLAPLVKAGEAIPIGTWWGCKGGRTDPFGFYPPGEQFRNRTSYRQLVATSDGIVVARGREEQVPGKGEVTTYSILGEPNLLHCYRATNSPSDDIAFDLIKRRWGDGGVMKPR